MMKSNVLAESNGVVGRNHQIMFSVTFSGVYFTQLLESYRSQRSINYETRQIDDSNKF